MPWRPVLLESTVQHRVPVVPLPGGVQAFVSTAGGWVHAVDTASGNLLWSTPLPEAAAQGAPAGIFTAYGGAFDYILVGTSAGGSSRRFPRRRPWRRARLWCRRSSRRGIPRARAR